jgi:hypothetical protein
MIQTIQWQSLEESQVALGFVLFINGPKRPLTLLAMPIVPPETLADPQKIVGLQPQSSNIPIQPAVPEQTPLKQNLIYLVESALKRLYDFSYLGAHPLTQLRIVRSQWKGKNQPLTSLDRAKAVNTFLVEIIERLRPRGPLPKRNAIPCREWHPYLILRQAYVEEEHNYTIMNWLQISEGTFNRTRRRALQIVAKTVAELEWQGTCICNEIHER